MIHKYPYYINVPVLSCLHQCCKTMTILHSRLVGYKEFHNLRVVIVCSTDKRSALRQAPHPLFMLNKKLHDVKLAFVRCNHKRTIAHVILHAHFAKQEGNNIHVSTLYSQDESCLAHTIL
eukprot:XP_001705255.1 Hypothetical protein GL50803_35459 [Giardia lamblia ATCC 50803]